MVNHLTHLNRKGKAIMVDVSPKLPQFRRAVASGEIRCSPATLRLLRQDKTPKGDVLATARIAGIQAAKQTSILIPLCHPLPLNAVSVDLVLLSNKIQISAEVRVHARTGVEMEALTAVSVAALTLYDMLKAVDRKMVIQNIHLTSKEKL